MNNVDNKIIEEMKQLINTAKREERERVIHQEIHDALRGLYGADIAIAAEVLMAKYCWNDIYGALNLLLDTLQGVFQALKNISSFLIAESLDIIFDDSQKGIGWDLAFWDFENKQRRKAYVPP